MENEKKIDNSVLQVATFKLEGLGCACETKLVEKRLKGLKGIKSYDINPISNQMKISYNPLLISTEDMTKSIAKTGVTASLLTTRK
jgi:copper chaperone CopZ